MTQYHHNHNRNNTNTTQQDTMHRHIDNIIDNPQNTIYIDNIIQYDTSIV